jgi:hypothetical protein
MDEPLKSRFEKVLEHYSRIINERNDALVREKMARDQFEASFRAAVDKVILPAAAQVKDLVEAKNWTLRFNRQIFQESRQSIVRTNDQLAPATCLRRRRRLAYPLTSKYV